MNNKCALNEFASKRFNALRNKESFEYEKLMGKKFNVSVLYKINKWKLFIFSFQSQTLKIAPIGFSQSNFNWPKLLGIKCLVGDC